MALDDADVQNQIKHMMAFIDQEANEKAEEIDAKAEEEFNIEKGRLVQEKRVKIRDYYERKEKQIELQKKIQNSNLLNQARLRVLKSREDHIQNLLDEALERLRQVSENKQSYQKLLESLLIQAAFQMMESNVVVRCRQADVQLVKGVTGTVADAYAGSMKKQLKMEVDNQNFLPADCCGGVELLARGGKMRVVNTLESRLQLLTTQMLPELREILFGHNPNRKFRD